jgi:hypothetical protein
MSTLKATLFLRGPSISATACAAALLLSTMPVHAGTVPAVYSTGVDDHGTVLPGGAGDPHWLVVAGPGVLLPRDAVIPWNQTPGGEHYPYSDAMWIASDSSGDAPNMAVFVYQQQFDLGAFDPSKFFITGHWSADDYGQILVNGAPAIGTGELSLQDYGLSPNRAYNYDWTHGFTITGGFKPGLNTIEFEIGNSGGGASGFAVSMAAVPEPASMAEAVIGLVGLMAWLRRRVASTRG